MTEERELTPEEQKAKEYVDFYYFWLFNYCTRNYKRELIKQLPILDHNLPNYKQRTDIARKIYWRHPIRGLSPQIYDYEDPTSGVVEDNLSSVGGATPDRPTTILETLYDEKDLYRGARKAPACGLEILGTDRASISSDGRLGGYIIAKIDLLAPVDDIVAALLQIKQTRFECFPNFIDTPIGAIYSEDMPGGFYIQQSNKIKQAGKASFAVKDDAARALGLWFWDVIDGEKKIFANFADTWKTIQGDQVKGISILRRSEYMILSSSVLRSMCVGINKDDQYEFNDCFKNTPSWQDDAFFFAASSDNPDRKIAVPSPNVFAKLGYSCSEPSTIRRLYRNTKNCIDTCEVLSLA